MADKSRWRDVKLNKECKATMALLIREIQDCKNKDEIDLVLKSWIVANDLHPEAVGVIDATTLGIALDNKGIRR